MNAAQSVSPYTCPYTASSRMVSREGRCGDCEDDAAAQHRWGAAPLQHSALQHSARQRSAAGAQPLPLLHSLALVSTWFT